MKKSKAGSKTSKKVVKKGKRKPSAYNMFMSKEMKKGLTMKEAAAKWRNQRK